MSTECTIDDVKEPPVARRFSYRILRRLASACAVTRTRRHDRTLLCGVAMRHALLALAVAATACGPATEAPKPQGSSGEWLEFEGSWNAAGSRRSISLGADRRSSIIDLRGTMLLAGPGRPGAGFHSEVIGLVDSATGLVGRGIWTDERGDQVFSELQGEGTAAKNHITGRILGGTGRYAGATGTYEFSWQWVMEAEDGSIQGRAVELKGRVRPGSAAGGSPK
jgi:hypothetical protein